VGDNVGDTVVQVKVFMMIVWRTMWYLWLWPMGRE